MNYKKRLVYSAKKYFLGIILLFIVFDISSYGLIKMYSDVSNGREYDYNSAFYNNFPRTYKFVKSIDFGLSDRLFVYLDNQINEDYAYEENTSYTNELSDMEKSALSDAIYNELMGTLPDDKKEPSEEVNSGMDTIETFTFDDVERVIYQFLQAYYDREYESVLTYLVPGSLIYENMLEEREYWNEDVKRTLNYVEVSGIEKISSYKYGAIVVISQNVQLAGGTGEHFIYYYYEIVNIDGRLYIDNERVLAQK